MAQEKRVEEREFQRKLLSLCKEYFLKGVLTVELVGDLEVVKHLIIQGKIK